MMPFSGHENQFLDSRGRNPRSSSLARRRPELPRPAVKSITKPLLHLLITFSAITCGCVQRQLTVHTDPEGAVVYLNDREMGRTPFTHDFLWYGNYDVVVRKDGCKTLKTTAEVTAPFWQFVPFDAITDFLPLIDRQTISFKLEPDAPADPKVLLSRGMEMQAELESSLHTVRHSVLDVHAPPTPATTQSTQPTTAPDIK